MVWRLVLTGRAEKDIEAILRHSHKEFGAEMAASYERQIVIALSQIAEDPNRAGSKSRRINQVLYRTFHIGMSTPKQRVQVARVKNPRHVLFYLKQSGDTLVVVRILHERMDFERQI